MCFKSKKPEKPLCPLQASTAKSITAVQVYNFQKYWQLYLFPILSKQKMHTSNKVRAHPYLLKTVSKHGNYFFFLSLSFYKCNSTTTTAVKRQKIHIAIMQTQILSFELSYKTRIYLKKNDRLILWIYTQAICDVLRVQVDIM